MTYKTALELALHLKVISEKGFRTLSEKQANHLDEEAPDSFVYCIENSPRATS